MDGFYLNVPRFSHSDGRKMGQSLERPFRDGMEIVARYPAGRTGFGMILFGPPPVPGRELKKAGLNGSLEGSFMAALASHLPLQRRTAPALCAETTGTAKRRGEGVGARWELPIPK